MPAQLSPPAVEYLEGGAGVFFAALVYVVVDIYPVVKSMRAALGTWSFWLYWFVYGVLDSIACSVLQNSAGSQISGKTQAEVNQDLDHMQQGAKDPRNFARVLARRIAQIDQLRAEQLLSR